MTPRRRKMFGVLIATSVALWGWWSYGPRTPATWTEADLSVLRSLSLDSLPPLPADPSNAVADDPRAAKFGHRLFFDTRLSANGAVSCATCHQPERQFSDGLPKGRGIGLSGRNTPSIVGTAYSPWLYWDGRRDSQWAQAISPLEDPAEHGGNRMQYVRFIANDPDYRSEYESIFGSLPDFSDPVRFPDAAAPIDDPQINAAWQAMTPGDRRRVNAVYANLGKSIAAYERLILHGPSRFDEYIAEISDGETNSSPAILTDEEILGLQLFIDEARCIECHNGPLFTNNEFHNTGILSFPGELPDRGRIDGLKQVQADPFNCLGDFSDDKNKDCAELIYVRTGIELVGATRTPSLRNLADTAPYARKGQQATLADVLDLYNRGPLAMIGHNEAEELNLGSRELQQLEAFLSTLNAPLSTADMWLTSPE